MASVIRRLNHAHGSCNSAALCTTRRPAQLCECHRLVNRCPPSPPFPSCGGSWHEGAPPLRQELSTASRCRNELAPRATGKERRGRNHPGFKGTTSAQHGFPKPKSTHPGTERSRRAAEGFCCRISTAKERHSSAVAPVSTGSFWGKP
eukprot:360002-Chlamydomonas_euryale.AAC.6